MRIFFVLLVFFNNSLAHAEKWGDTDLSRWNSGDWQVTIQDYGKSIGKSCYLLGRGMNADGLTTHLWLFPTGETIGAFTKKIESAYLSVDFGVLDIATKDYVNQTDDVVAVFQGDYKGLYRVGSQAFYAKLKDNNDFPIFIVKAKDNNGRFVTMTFSSDGLLSARDFLLDKCW